ncbi:unnamed protein product [Periconia digitata]|uniref:Uncharacterized protein n=1 Tax=Periconia digitata TaxID=1303443 RepID=A0A9W4XLR8_9PLEO|nr:unnamed protein product [Periconia digitata]
MTWSPSGRSILVLPAAALYSLRCFNKTRSPLTITYLANAICFLVYSSCVLICKLNLHVSIWVELHT